MNKRESFDFSAPSNLIGQSIVRPNARKHVEGAGQFVDDIVLPRMAHVYFLRSPHAHARIVKIDASAARRMPGVIHIATGSDIARVCKPYVGVLSHLQGLRSPPQYPLAIDIARWQGEPIAAVVAESRAEAEDAGESVAVDWEELPVSVDMECALEPGHPVIHREYGSNLCFQRIVDTGSVEDAFKNAALVVEDTLQVGRHTGVPLEPRGLIAAYSRSEKTLTVYHSHQSLHMMQGTFATYLSIPEQKVRVISPDVGGGFGIKVHTYGDEVATCALSIILGRPIKFIADRFESFLSDIHARDHRVRARLALDSQGTILAFDLDDLTGIGPYSMFPRTSAIECNQVVGMTGSPYKHKLYRAKGSVVFQNKNMMCQYRGVGHPIAIAVAEHLIDRAAAQMRLDPAELRQRNLIPDDAYPYKSPTGMLFEALSHQRTLAKLLTAMDYQGLRKEQAALRERGVYRGIGLSVFFEITNPSAMFYGVGGARIGAQEGCTMRLEPSGALVVSTGITEQGQGAETVVAQIAASAVGVPMDIVRVINGDTHACPPGSGAWASRQTGIVGEAVLQAGIALKKNILEAGAILLQTPPDQLDIIDGKIITKMGQASIELAELARICYYRGNELPVDFQPDLMTSRQFRVKEYPFVFANGAMSSLVEVDPETGFVKLLKLWCVDDSGRVVNPKLLDEQIRGGAVMGIGAALFEHCYYDAQGQLLNCTLADYLLPLASDVPDIETMHTETLTNTSELGAKGVGESGTSGAPAAILNAVNDALLPLNAKVTSQPITPDVVLRALGKIS